jgi:hypothetical protein
VNYSDMGRTLSEAFKKEVKNEIIYYKKYGLFKTADWDIMREVRRRLKISESQNNKPKKSIRQKDLMKKHYKRKRKVIKKH